MQRILFIEDESALQKAVGEMLTKRGYGILSALDGETGLALALREHPDLILLDITLPKKDGFAVLEALKKDPVTRGIPVIIMSNRETDLEVDRALELGATTYLVKMNYNLEEVADKIKYALAAA